jgi:sarcosine oxidase subunit gamma
MLRKGRLDALRTSLRTQHGIGLPDGPRRTTAGPLALAGIGPTTWLAVHETGGNAFAGSFGQSLTGLASVANQSDGYAVLRLTGPKARDTLAKGVAIDLHERAFPANAVAVTDVSHIGIILWRLQHAAPAIPVFEIAVVRSLAASFAAWLVESAGEYGLGAPSAAAETAQAG